MRAIDADLLEPDAEYDDGEFWAYSKTQIDNAPTITPVRKRGRWLHVEPEPEVMLGWMPWYCSECGVGVGKHQTAFCPNCGADMRGEQDGRDD